MHGRRVSIVVPLFGAAILAAVSRLFCVQNIAVSNFGNISSKISNATDRVPFVI